MSKFTDEKKQTAYSPLAGWMKRQRLIDRLSALDDRMLDDMGVQRFEIQGIAERAFPRANFKAYIVASVAAIRKSLRQRSSTRQLASLDDRMLADIGLQRSEIPGAVRGDMPFRAFSMPNIMSVSRAELVHSIPDLASVPAPVAVDEEKHRIAA